VDSWIEQYRSFWSASLTNLKEFVETEYEKEQAGEREQREKGKPREKK